MWSIIPFERRQRDITDYFDQIEKSMFGDFGKAYASIKTDIMDEGGHYLLKCELPGLKKEDINIEIDHDVLTVSAEHKEENEDKKDNYVRIERRYGSFSRSFDISDIAPDQITAAYENGILKLQLPKKAPQVADPARKVQIN